MLIIIIIIIVVVSLVGSPVCLHLVIDNTLVLSACFVWEHRPVHAVSSRLWQRQGPGKEQEVHIWHSSRSLQHHRGGHHPEPHPWERYERLRGADT